MSYKRVFFEGSEYEITFYYKDEQCKIVHREDGPARDVKNRVKTWIINGMYHRMDGPAVEYYDGRKEYWLYNSNYSEERYFKELEKIKRFGSFV